MTFAQPAAAAYNHAIDQLADDPAAAAHLYKRFAEARRHLERFPNLGRAGNRPGIRELVIAGTPYVFVYRVDPDALVILDIRHGRRKPS